MKRLLRIILFCIIPVISFAQTALIEIPFNFNDGQVGAREMNVGLDPTATDGVDPALGETYAPPPPPTGAFEVKFILPTLDETYKDIREGDNTSSSIGDIIHKVWYQLGSGSAGLQISWDLPGGVGLNISDDFGGTFYSVDFPSGPGTYTISTTPFLPPPPAVLTVHYIIPPFPVELTSFNAIVINETVQLNWETATELNNYGFDIERNTEGNWQKIGFVEGNGNSNSPKSYQFTDFKPLNGSRFIYRLKQIDNDGAFEYSNEVEVDLSPTEYELYQNYPNPFNPNTRIKYSVPFQSKVTLTVFNTLGQQLRVLVDEVKDIGIYEVEFNSQELGSGIYFYTLTTDKFAETKKMSLLK